MDVADPAVVPLLEELQENQKAVRHIMGFKYMCYIIGVCDIHLCMYIYWGVPTAVNPSYWHMFSTIILLDLVGGIYRMCWNMYIEILIMFNHVKTLCYGAG